MKNKMVPGNTLILGSLGFHPHALYLGADDSGEKVLMPTMEGYSIVDMEDVGEYQLSGTFNLRGHEVVDGLSQSFNYIFFDVVDEDNFVEREVRVERLGGFFEIVNRPEEPSWAGGF